MARKTSAALESGVSQFNIYDMNWNYLGCYWGIDNSPEGEIRLIETFTGPIQTPSGEEHDRIRPLRVYRKKLTITTQPMPKKSL